MEKRLFFYRVAVLLGVGLFATHSSAQTKEWDRRFGGFNDDRANGIVPTLDGQFLIVGESWSGASGDRTESTRGFNDFWVTKISEFGNKLWDRRFGGNDADIAIAVSVSPNGWFTIAGHSNSSAIGDKSEPSRGGRDLWVVRMDANGNKIWDRRFGGTGTDSLGAIVASPDGGWVLAGYSESPAGGDKTQGSRGWFDWWIVKIDVNGNKVWDRRFGGTDFDAASGIARVPTGGYIIVGESSSGANGDKTENLRGNTDVWAVKIDENGNKVWDRRFGGNAFDAGYAITQATGGGYIIAGVSSSVASGDQTHQPRGTRDAWFIKIDENGSKVWDWRYGGSGFDRIEAIHRVEYGGYVATGYTESPMSGEVSQPSRGDRDVWVLRLADCGGLLWERRYGGSEADRGAAIALAPDGAFMIAATSESGAEGDHTQPNWGGEDFWLLRLMERQPSEQHFDAQQPIAAFANNRWSFMTAWNLCTGEFQSSPLWRNGAYTWTHNADQYWQWIARFTYDDSMNRTTSLAWFYRQMHVQ